MNGMPVDPQILNLLRDLRPFLGPQAAAATELAEACVDLLSSDGGRRALQTFARVMGSESLLSSEGKPTANPFLLFLVLILLIFSFSDPEPEGVGIMPA
ncbi:MAG: hypothetical protein ACPLPT_08460 [Moorellales bacterium]